MHVDSIANTVGNRSTAPKSPRWDRRHKGIGRLIVAVYGVFAFSAMARASYQIITKFDEAPISYALSGFSALVYVVATIALAIPGKKAWIVAMVAVTVELVGVIGVGIWSYAQPELFQHASIWSHFGEGYGYIPLILPFVGLFWLVKHAPKNADSHQADTVQTTEAVVSAQRR